MPFKINLFYHTISDNKCSFPSLFLFASGDVIASITVDVIFFPVVIDVNNVHLAVGVTTVDAVFFADAIAVVVTVPVAIITVDTVSLVVITVIFVVVFVPTIRIDVVCHAVINVVDVVDFFVNIIFADVFVVLFIVAADFIDPIFLFFLLILVVVYLNSHGADSAILSVWLFVSILWHLLSDIFFSLIS